MTAMELDAYRADVAREVLNISSFSLLDKIKKLIRKEEKAKATDEFVPRTHDELVADFKEALNEAKLNMEGKLVLPSWEEVLDEL